MQGTGVNIPMFFEKKHVFGIPELFDAQPHLGELMIFIGLQKHWKHCAQQALSKTGHQAMQPSEAPNQQI